MFIFCVNATIGFFLSPFIVRTLGVEAAGFIQLAANFASYISLITIALNSMSGRFITIALTKGENEKAISYYTSVFWANLALFVLLLLPIAIVIVKCGFTYQYIRSSCVGCENSVWFRVCQPCVGEFGIALE
jgi:O-antigen/teichoic acid export membrane protein